jgi:N-acetylmuramoyl-L-alanine amidase
VNVTPDHFLEEAERQVLSGGNPLKVRRVLIIHFTAGMSAASSLEWWRDPEAKGANAHLLIDRDGTVIQCRAFDLTANHAGKSRWRDPNTGTLYDGVNSCGIGIELANAGDNVSGSVAAPKAFGKYPCEAGAIRAEHKNEDAIKMWEKYPRAQLDACFAAAKALVDRYKLDDVCGHEDIAPERKNDPGPAFPMQELREFVGFAGLPRVNRL